MDALQNVVENGIREGGVVSVIDGQLTGNQQRAGAVAVVDELEQILGRGAVEFF